jgi:hypothetical protein
MKKIKEISLNVDTSRFASPYVKNRQNYYSGYSGGMTDSAASMTNTLDNSRIFSSDEFEEESEEEINLMPENILNCRVKNKKGYALSETLYVLNENWEIMDTAAGALKYGSRALKAAGKSTVLSIPFIDAIAGSMMLISGIGSFKSVSDIIIEKIRVPENTFAEALASDSENSWQDIISVVGNLSEEERQSLEENFEDLLHNLKTFISTAFQAYDSIFASAGAAGGPIGLGAAEAGTNFTTAIAGFISDTVPWERFALDVVGKFAGMIESMFNYILKQKEQDKNGKLNKAINDGGPIFLAILTNPVQSIRRLGEFYTAIETGNSPIADVTSAAVDSAKSKLTLDNLESIIDLAINSQMSENNYYGIDEYDEEEEAEDIEEIGYALPLGASNKSFDKKDDHHVIAEEIRKFQDWQLKTLGRTR